MFVSTESVSDGVNVIITIVIVAKFDCIYISVPGMCCVLTIKIHITGSTPLLKALDKIIQLNSFLCSTVEQWQ